MPVGRVIIENAPAAVFMLPGALGELTRLLTGSYWTQVAIEAAVQSRLLQPPQIRIFPSEETSVGKTPAPGV